MRQRRRRRQEDDWSHSPRPARDKLVLGYLSNDFRAHAVASLVAELFEQHDRERRGGKRRGSQRRGGKSRGGAVRVEPLPPEPIWNRWPVAALVLGLLALEWSLRKKWDLL